MPLPLPYSLYHLPSLLCAFLTLSGAAFARLKRHEKYHCSFSAGIAGQHFLRLNAAQHFWQKDAA
jgi:hypothetical protein